MSREAVINTGLGEDNDHSIVDGGMVAFVATESSESPKPTMLNVWPEEEAVVTALHYAISPIDVHLLRWMVARREGISEDEARIVVQSTLTKLRRHIRIDNSAEPRKPGIYTMHPQNTIVQFTDGRRLDLGILLQDRQRPQQEEEKAHSDVVVDPPKRVPKAKPTTFARMSPDVVKEQHMQRITAVIETIDDKEFREAVRGQLTDIKNGIFAVNTIEWPIPANRARGVLNVILGEGIAPTIQALVTRCLEHGIIQNVPHYRGIRFEENAIMAMVAVCMVGHTVLGGEGDMPWDDLRSRTRRLLGKQHVLVEYLQEEETLPEYVAAEEQVFDPNSPALREVNQQLVNERSLKLLASYLETVPAGAGINIRGIQERTGLRWIHCEAIWRIYRLVEELRQHKSIKLPLKELFGLDVDHIQQVNVGEMSRAVAKCVALFPQVRNVVLNQRRDMETTLGLMYYMLSMKYQQEVDK